ncbi:MAG TPA: flavin oxidoreductase [Firmicutes bacterium]|nr:flavin oxidoreductase [Bacillota bacterium]
MKKDLGIKPYFFPMPVALIATYDEKGKVDVMNMAWGCMVDNNMILCCLSEDHKTVKNLRLGKDFTISIANKEHAPEADYFGIDSGNTVLDKFERSGIHARKSEHVDAPILDEYPLNIECKLHALRHDEDGNFFAYGEIVNVLADESVLDENDKVDVSKLHAICFSQIDSTYYEIGNPVGKAWNIGLPYHKK